MLKCINFSDYICFSEYLITLNENYPVVSVYGKFVEIKTILRILIEKGIGIGGGICLEDPEISGYDKEFVLCLTSDGVSVEKIWHEDNKYFSAGYSLSMGDVAFVHGECNSKILKSIESDIIFELRITADQDEDCNSSDTDDNAEEDFDEVNYKSESTYISRTKDGTPEGFTKTQTIIENGFTRTITFSYYSDDIDYLKDKAEYWDIELQDEDECEGKKSKL